MESAFASQGRSMGASGSSQSPNCIAGPRSHPSRAGQQAGRPGQHAVELALENSRIAVGLVDRPGHDRCGICPSGPPKTSLALDDHIRNDGGQTQVVVLIQTQIRQPAQPKGLGVEKGASSRRESLGVSGPPSLSSRCGQSVGRETKLSRCDHTTFSCKRLRPGWEHSKLDLGVRSLLITTNSAARSSASLSTSAYRKPWKVKAGSS